MAMGEAKPTEEQAVVNNNNEEEEDEEESEEEDESYYSSSDDEDGGGSGGPGRATAAAGYSSSDEEEGGEGDNSPEANFRKFSKALDNPYLKRALEREERNVEHPEELFDFPRDPENWQEEDLREQWADGPVMSGEPGWDPVWADEEEWEMVKDEIKRGNDPPIAPFYVPYRKFYPVIPDNHFDIDNPKAAIEELDRIEEFLKWVSFVFADGSTYEGTVWDDLAHGKGVYVADEGLVRYEGEWLRNLMEGHGVVEVEVPGVEPVPGSKLEAKMRAQGRIISRDFKSPEDKKWLEMDIEDTVLLADGRREIPFYEREAWVKVFGQKPEKGRYRYAGQWKHGRMHGCGVYEVNERIIYGRFYFGDHLEDSTGCDSNVSALHAGIAEVAAAKARMFINKPDGMVREERGPYGDPQHPYFYEEDDVWMAPGFVNQFYEVPDYWKTYVQEVDQEREMWLNSFHKAPLRIPMPAELEYWWSKDQGPEFVLINKEPEPDPEDPSNLIYTEDPLIVHTPTGRLINYVEDEEHGVRLFWQPHLEKGEDVDPEKAEFLPLGFDEFYGQTAPGEKKEGKFKALITAMENALKPLFERLDNWVEDKRKASELKRKLIDAELELIEAEICLEEALEDRENELKMKQKEEEKRAAAVKDNDQVSGEGAEYDADSEDEDEDDGAPTSFGTVQQAETDKSENKSAKSPFSSLTLSVASPGLISMVSSKLQNSFLSWEKARYRPFIPDVSSNQNEMILMGDQRKSISVTFRSSSRGRANLKVIQRFQLPSRNNGSKLRPLARILSSEQTRRSSEIDHGSNGAPHNLSILSLHVPVDICTLS